MQPEPLNLPIEASIAYSDKKGNYKKGIEKRQQKTLSKVTPLLSRILEPDEKILMAAKACSPMGFFEPLGMGAWAYYFKRCILVLTDRRILHLPTKTDYAHRDSVAEIRFGDLDSVKSASFLGYSFTFQYKNGKKERFAKVQSADYKRFKDALDARLVASGLKPTTAMGRVHLCPRYVKPLSEGVYSCPKCHLAFKDMATARKWSILLPGGGYFYTGQAGFGILDALMETFLIVMLVLIALGIDDSPDAAATLGVIAIALVFEKLITIMHAGHRIKEFLPAEKVMQAVPVRPGQSNRPLTP
ncbi:MAG: hypothetical protein AB1921_07435 [Thermodesulfobacteriota bacterium]